MNQCIKVNTPGGIVVWGSKEIKTKNLDLEFFNEIIVGDKFHVNIKQGENYSINVKTNENLQNFLLIEKKWTVLRIKMKPNHFYKDAILEIDMTIPDLIYLNINGMSKVKINDFFNKQNMKVELSEDSFFEGNLNVNHLELKVSASSVDLSGKVNFLKTEATLTSKLEMSKLFVNKANILLNVESEGDFYITDLLNAGLQNKSVLRYTGGAKEGNIIKDDFSQIIKK